jgi:hypothetical protein
MASPANLPSGTVGCTASPTNSPTKTILAPRNAKSVQRSPHVYNTHNIQITSSNNTIDEHLSQIWLPCHLPRQDQIRNYPKHTRQHIIYKNTSDKNHKPPQYLLLPEIWSSRRNNRSRFAHLWTTRHSWQEQVNKYLKKQTSNYNTQIYMQQEPQTPSTDTVTSRYLVFPPKQPF